MIEAVQALQPESGTGSGADDAVGVDGLPLLKLPHSGVGFRAERQEPTKSRTHAILSLLEILFKFRE